MKEDKRRQAIGAFGTMVTGDSPMVMICLGSIQVGEYKPGVVCFSGEELHSRARDDDGLFDCT